MNKYSLKNWLVFDNPHYNTRPIYWSVFDYETQIRTPFDLKSDALLFKRKLPHASIDFHWHEDTFSRINLMQEPALSHSELCKNRALELRERYDYVRLWFSGGADSRTALDSFVNNNIHIDEIVVNCYLDKNVTDVMASTNREVELVALPYLKEIQNKLTNTKITLLQAEASDVTDWFSIRDDPAWFPALDSLDGSAGQLNLGMSWGMSKLNRKTEIKNWVDVQGGSKVRLWKHKEKWFFYFVDSAVHDSYTSLRFEDFFISRTNPDLYLKTVYLLKKFHQDNNSTDQFINTLHQNNSLVEIYNQNMGRHRVPLIAQTKVHVMASTNREFWEKTKIYGFYNTAFFKNVQNTDHGKWWHKQYLTLMSTITRDFSDFWNVNAYGDLTPSLGYKGHLSKFYCLNDNRSYNSTEVGFQ
jgi:hypothetical protein